MNKTLISIVVVVLVFVGAFYYFKSPASAPGTVDQAEVNTEVQSNNPRPVILALEELNGSGQSGTVGFAEMDGQVHVIVQLNGSNDSTPQPAHIHVGSCPGVGAVKYPLTSLIKGVSETMIPTTLAELLSEPLAVNVHKSAANLQAYVACGNISAEGTTVPVNTNGSSSSGSGGGAIPSDASASVGAQPVAGVKTFDVSASNFAFSLKEIKVRKGDTVKINFKNDMGFHDLVIDEFNARTKQISAGASETITFVADKAGSFEYYCSVGSHRQMGMKGTLIVE